MYYTQVINDGKIFYRNTVWWRWLAVRFNIKTYPAWACSLDDPSHRHIGPFLPMSAFLHSTYQTQCATLRSLQILLATETVDKEKKCLNSCTPHGASSHHQDCLFPVALFYLKELHSLLFQNKYILASTVVDF